MNQTVDILCRARTLYASAPSHAPLSEGPMPGTLCVRYAISMASQAPQSRVAASAFARAVGTSLVAKWNAEHSTEEVLAAFDRAIAAQRLVVPELQRAEQRDPVHAGS